MTTQEGETSVSAAIAKAMGGEAQQTNAQAQQDGAGAVQKQQEGGNAAPAELTPEAIEKMVQTAIEKAMQPQQETVTAEQVQDMITKAVAAAVDPVLKSKGLPSNLNGSTVEKQAGEEHYLHGIL